MSREREELIEVMAMAAFYADMKLCEDAFGPDAETWEDNRRQPAYRTIAQAALSAIEGAGFEIRLRAAPGAMAPPKPGDRVTVRTLVAHVEGNSFKPASGWHSTDLIVSNEGPNMSPTPPTTEEEEA